MKFIVYRDGKREWRWRLVAKNGRVIADSGEGYKRVAACRNGIARVQQSGDASVILPEGKELDMGSGFDFFGEASYTKRRNITQEQKIHRLLLKSIMEKYGFVNYDREWWHYTLKNEPFPDTYFNFPVR